MHYRMHTSPSGMRDLSLNVSYDSDTSDLLNDFYIPVLSKAVKYQRLAGFFSSSVLAVAARGLSSFIVNGGTMKLLVSARLQKTDVEAISKGYELKDVLSESIVNDLSTIEDELVKDHVKALAWMVRNGKLDIKVAVPLDTRGLPLDEGTIQQRGIFHQKIGILEDKNGDVLSFSGSVNESATAWTENIEEIKVFRSWIDGEMEHLKSDFQRFERYWYGNAKNMLVSDIPSAVQNKLIELAPDDITDIRLNLEYGKSAKKIKLRDYQQDCVAQWLKVGRGMVEMATGTGKTFVAIACIDQMQRRNEKLVVAISCPFIHLIEQWEKNLKVWNLQALKVFGGSNMWADKLMNTIHDVNNGYRKFAIIITTHDTFASDKFTDIISKIKAPTMLVADEVHGLGSSERRKGLLDAYKYRIGLSATPRRWFDDEGTEVIFEYFGDTIIEVTLKDAIPTFLTPYEYYPSFVDLTAEELQEYRNLTKRIARKYFTNKDNKEQKDKEIELLMIKRQRIIVNARNKMVEFERILDSLESISNCLVYCSPEQILEVQDILNRRGIVQHKFTAQEAMNERKEILESFESGTYQVLVAMKCLDEGVDVPATHTAIILASSTNSREFIQRRGRILRKHPGKEKATIYDIMVVPSLQPDPDPQLMELEGKIIRKELLRVMEFADCSGNPVETLNKIYPILKTYRIPIQEIKN